MARTLNKRVQARKLVRERAGGRCEVCGVELTPDERPSMHHRWRVAAKGRDGVMNLLHLCWQCHVIGVHQNETQAYSLGLLVFGEQDTTKPVLTRHGWVKLTKDGDYQELSSRECAALTKAHDERCRVNLHEDEAGRVHAATG